MYDPDNRQSLEKYSSTLTLSDMEIFIFPELIYSLMLANIMSPLLWEFKKDPWFKKIDKMNDYRKILRIKQFIMDKFVFNLDLDTWGLTSKVQELKRFSTYIDQSILAQSNALFGYEGDKYYFDIDIRRHFGLDKYNSNIIPYWKTETIEAMDAFKYKSQYPGGAGECVSLSTLYCAALFVIGGIALEKINLMATPLHSQNFIDVKEGIITNNRRIVSKTMWFNGTELSAKARRALENEKVTMVVNNTGYIHSIYKEATIDPDSYTNFKQKVNDYLKTDVSFQILANFLRYKSDLQKCFQYKHTCYGKTRYIAAEKIFHYEHSSNYLFGSQDTYNLLCEIDEYDFYSSPLPDRIQLNNLQEVLNSCQFPIDSPKSVEKLRKELSQNCYIVNKVIRELIDFCKVIPRLPDQDKKFLKSPPIRLKPGFTRENIINYLGSIREENTIADLAFYAFRDMNKISYKPFLKAAIERNPVCIAESGTIEIEKCYQELLKMENYSIYDGSRLAQPDEVWNFKRGDGIEKAICLLTILKNRIKKFKFQLKRENSTIRLTTDEGDNFFFTSHKNVPLPQTEDFLF